MRPTTNLYRNGMDIINGELSTYSENLARLSFLDIDSYCFAHFCTEKTNIRSRIY